MKNKEVFDLFEKIHSYTFSTIRENMPESRVAHFTTYDEEGLYFMTMKVKPFYKQLIGDGGLSVCALVSEHGSVKEDEEGLSGFPSGYFVKITGKVKELTEKELEEKVEINQSFLGMINDKKRYPTMTAFVVYEYQGEIFDYDFEMQHRENKINRTRFYFGNTAGEDAGFKIDREKCIACGKCYKACTFHAIIPGKPHKIYGEFCDECGSCYIVCPVNAIEVKNEIDEVERKKMGLQLKNWMKGN